MGSIIDQGVKLASLGTINTDFSGAKASASALEAQRGATEAANARSDASLADQKKILEPWQTAGLKALSGLQDGSFMTNDPGYQFRLDQGNKAINNAASARGMSNSGATMKALTDYGQNFATNEYQNAFNRQNVLANYGNQASTNMANLIGGNAAQFGQNAIGLGNSQAASYIGQANRDSQMLGSVIGAGASFLSGGGLGSSGKMSAMVEPANGYASTGLSGQYSLGNTGINPSYLSYGAR